MEPAALRPRSSARHRRGRAWKWCRCSASGSNAGTGWSLRRPPRSLAACAMPRESNFVHGRNLASRRRIDPQ
eukprot:scaffold20521_cov59-Phaeocystis_antarctica.AAC.1